MKSKQDKVISFFSDVVETAHKEIARLIVEEFE